MAAAVALPPIARHRFTADEYHRMAVAGILAEDARVELLDGEVIEMAPIGPRHAATVERVVDLLRARLPGTAMVRTQNPLALGPHSEPQPDVAVVRHRADYYAGSHPTADDTLLVVEIADASLRLDREVKLPLYARAGVREVWLVDLEAEAVQVHRSPSDSGYAVRQSLRRGQEATPESLPGVVLSVTALLGE